jgi:hypothetical protein
VGVYETFSKRKKRLESAGKQEVYQYDQLPQTFRVQVIHIWNSAIGAYYRPSGYSYAESSPANKLWEFIFSTTRRERGVFALAHPHDGPADQCKQFLLDSDTDCALDIIELSFRVIDLAARKFQLWEIDRARVTQTPDDAIEELNQRFREHTIGYQHEEGKLIRVDSQFVHAEAVKPAMSLLNQPGFDGPAEEFIGAFDHYRHGRHKEAVAEALKSFESTMKAICKLRGWAHPPNATAKPLMDTLFKNGLIPQGLESHFAGLRAAMESGLPTISNPNRHGQGPDPVAIPPHIAAYALHLAASNILLLVQAHSASK